VHLDRRKANIASLRLFGSLAQSMTVTLKTVVRVAIDGIASGWSKHTEFLARTPFRPPLRLAEPGQRQSPSCCVPKTPADSVLINDTPHVFNRGVNKMNRHREYMQD